MKWSHAVYSALASRTGPEPASIVSLVRELGGSANAAEAAGVTQRAVERWIARETLSGSQARTASQQSITALRDAAWQQQAARTARRIAERGTWLNLVAYICISNDCRVRRIRWYIDAGNADLDDFADAVDEGDYDAAGESFGYAFAGDYFGTIDMIDFDNTAMVDVDELTFSR